MTKLAEDQGSAGGNSKTSRRTNRGGPVSATGGGAGGAVDSEFKVETEAKFEDIARTIEDIKFEQNRLQQEIDKTANNLTMNQMNMNSSPSKNNAKDDGKAAANAEENRKKIKEIESSIRNLNSKFSEEIESLKLMSAVSKGGGGGSGGDNGAQA